MPYRTRRVKRMASRFFKRRSGAMSIQRAWRARQRRKRGGLIERTAKSNRTAIKKLKSSREVKYATAKQASLTNMFVGQHVIFDPDIWGFSNQNMDTPVWSGGSMTQPPTALTPLNWKTCCLKPLCIPQGVTDSTRLGEYVQLRWLNIKGTASAYNARYNGQGALSGYDYKNMPQYQRVRILVVLDTAPQVFRTPTAWDNTKQALTLFNMLNSAQELGAVPTGLNLASYLRDGPKAGAGGAQFANGKYDPWTTSYWENNYVQSKSTKTAKNRFKVLKVLNLGEMRQPAAQQGDDAGPTPSQRNFSFTLKAPYKLHFKNALDDLPANQQIYVLVQSTTRPCGSNTNDIQINPIRAPKVEIQCKVAFIDP